MQQQLPISAPPQHPCWPCHLCTLLSFFLWPLRAFPACFFVLATTFPVSSVVTLVLGRDLTWCWWACTPWPHSRSCLCWWRDAWCTLSDFKGRVLRVAWSDDLLGVWAPPSGVSFGLVFFNFVGLLGFCLVWYTLFLSLARTVCVVSCPLFMPL
jgi:hypothetical protein